VAYDVAINSAFFTKVDNSLLFQTFLITIAMEGLEDKYKMELDKNGTLPKKLHWCWISHILHSLGWNILKNRRCFGSIQTHRIEQRHEKPYVQEVPKKSQFKGNKCPKLIEEVDHVAVKTNTTEQLKNATPSYSLVATRDGTKIVLARIPIWQCEIGNISLSVISDDCVCVKGGEGQNIINVNLPHPVDALKSKAIFNKSTKIVTILLPLMWNILL